ncbi:MAG: hypothetical protein NT072_05470 [Deltaproteobacteria bacterium]|nr:hypothetical protein [Deltaproteobacteria bacterium]
MKRVAVILIACIFAITPVIQGCGQKAVVKSDDTNSQKLEEEYSSLKEKATLKRTEKRAAQLNALSQKPDPQQTADYIFRKAGEYEGIEILTAYDYYKEFVKRFSRDARTAVAQEKIKLIEQSNMEKIKVDVEGRTDLREKIDVLEQNILDYNSYISREDLDYLKQYLNTLQTEYMAMPQ